MKLLILISLCILHFITGYGVLDLLKVRNLAPPVRTALSLIAGIMVASWSCFILQLAYIPLTFTSVYCLLLLLALILNIGIISRHRHWQVPKISLHPIKLYEWPFILLIGYALIGSTWRCYNLPTQVRDLLSGPEAIAEFALREHTFINSVFQTNLETTNNQFKSPFMHSLLFIYKLAGFKYGGLWLPQIVFSYTLLLFAFLKKTIHPLIAGILILFLFSAPEHFAYTYLVLYDYSNAVLFFLGYYFLLQYTKDWDRPTLYLSIFLFASSVYVRSETLILIVFTLPLLLFRGRKDKIPAKRFLSAALSIAFCSFIAFFIVIEIYNNHYLPQNYKVTEDVMNKNLLNLQPFFTRAKLVWQTLLTGKWSIILFGYIFYIFFLFFVAELLLVRKFSRQAIEWLYGIFIVLFGLLFTGFLFPLMDINHSTKRGLFKILPFIVFYLANNRFVQSFSQKIDSWEYKNENKTPARNRPLNQKKHI